MDCCTHCQDADCFFDRKTAEKELQQYREDGPPNKSTQMLIDVLKELNLDDKTLLDIGGGVGMIQHELLDHRLSRSLLVEASSPYLDAAREEAERRGHTDRTDFQFGDFVELAPELPDYDVVTLDRVICCYPHLEQLVVSSTEKASRWYAVVYPKERWFIRTGAKLMNLYFRIRGMDFRLYAHENIDEVIQAQGFSPVHQEETILWKVHLYERNSTS